MSLLQTIDPARLGTPVRAKAAPDRLIAGDPDFLTWALDSSRDGEVRTGDWPSSGELDHAVEDMAELDAAMLISTTDMRRKPEPRRARRSALVNPDL